MAPPYVAIEAGAFVGGALAGALAWRQCGALVLRGAHSMAAALCARAPAPPLPEAPEATIQRLRAELEQLEAEVAELLAQRGL